MSMYYHSFVPGFNAWYIVWPLLVAATAFVGGIRYYLNDEWKIRSAFGSMVYLLLIGLEELTLAVMFVRESWSGLLQYCLNGLVANESPFWAAVLAIIATEAMLVAFGLSLLFAGYYGSMRRIRALKHMRRAHFREEREQQEQMMNGAEAPKLRVIRKHEAG